MSKVTSIRWEYKVVYARTLELQDTLNEYGSHGWEFASLTPATEDYVPPHRIIFKSAYTIEETDE